MRVSLETEVRLFWQHAGKVRDKLKSGTLTEDDEDLDEIHLTIAYTEHENVRALCQELLDEVSPVEQLRDVG